MRYFKTITNLFIFVLLSFPTLFSIAQTPSASFTTGPNVTFIQGNNNATVASVSAQISVSGINMSDVAIVQAVFDEDVSTWLNDPSLDVNYILMWGGELMTSNGNLNGQIGSTCSSCFPPGTSQYFVFRIVDTSSGELPFPILTSVMVSSVVPGALAGGNNPPGQTGAGGQNPGSGDVNQENGLDPEGWPQNVLPNNLAVSDLNSFIVGLLNALLKIGIPVLTVFLVYSGLRLVMARGNEKELADAKKNLLWVIIGGAVLLGAWTIVKVLKGTFDQIDLAFINSLINFIV